MDLDEFDELEAAEASPEAVTVANELLRGARSPRKQPARVPGMRAPVVFEHKRYTQIRFPSLTEEEYVAMQTEETKRWIAKNNVVDKVLNAKGDGYDVVDPEERIQRSTEYARWRYRGYIVGEVDSL